MTLSERIIDIFKEIAKIPRQSKHEQKISQWLVDRAKADGFEVERDEFMNVFIRVPATPGYENGPIVILQGHMDMVCEKTPDSNHNFQTDPIEVIMENGWMHANKTTLGADDGLGVATALAMAEDKSIEHPALELFFTIDEEQGMTGANAFDPAKLKGRIFLNIDSEDEGIFTVGSAGGCGTNSTLSLTKAPIPAGYRKLNVHVTGLLGGHSGTDINAGRASAIKLLARLASNMLTEFHDVRLIDIKGGSAHNAIPRDALMTLAIKPEDTNKSIELLENLGKTFASEFKATDKDVKIIATTDDISGDAFDTASLQKVADLIMVYPHGVAAMSHEAPGIVETSCNLASISIKDGKLHLLSSQRSSVPSKLKTLTSRIEAAVRLAGGEPISGEGYPAWQPDMEADIIKRCVTTYAKRFGHEPKIEIIHAGLECSIIGNKIPDMQMISFGPTILSPHSPQERSEIATIGMVGDFLADLLKTYK